MARLWIPIRRLLPFGAIGLCFDKPYTAQYGNKPKNLFVAAASTSQGRPQHVEASLIYARAPIRASVADCVCDEPRASMKSASI